MYAQGVPLMIEFLNVSKSYPNGVLALDHINLKVENGEFVFIVGKSGAGKSTLIKLLLKEIEPTTGSVIVNNRDIAGLKRREIPYYRRGFGVVFQDFRLLPDRTVYDNIAFAMQITGAGMKQIRKQVPYVLDCVNLSSKAKVFPHQLSGGEQQRVCLARAMVNNPTVLIADEPTGNLDPISSREVVKILDELHHRGTTIIMATHAKDIVNSLRKRVITIHNGYIVQDQKKGVYVDEI